MLINKSYHISSFWSLRKFNDKLPFLWHLLDRKLPKMGRKLKQSLEIPISTHELYVSQGKICASARVGKSFTKCLLSEFSVRSSSKNDISSCISPISFIQMVNALCLAKKLVIKVSMVRRSCLVIFNFKEKFCFAGFGASASHLRDVYFQSVPKTLPKKLYLQL